MIKVVSHSLICRAAIAETLADLQSRGLKKIGFIDNGLL